MVDGQRRFYRTMMNDAEFAGRVRQAERPSLRRRSTRRRSVFTATMRRAAWLVLFALGVARPTAARAEQRLDDEDVSRSAAPAARPLVSLFETHCASTRRDRFLQEVRDGIPGVTQRDVRDRAREREMATVNLDEVDKDQRPNVIL